MRSVPARSYPVWSGGSPRGQVACPSAHPRTWRHSRPHVRREEKSLMFDLTGKTALVTGATGGIGGAIARALHQQGATVALSGTRREVLDQLAAELATRVHVLPANLCKKDEVEARVP